ncbi:hypothetical protein TSST111916_16820 [Tsukamurella strandjordii]|uniref:DUF7373 family lipoprotein n=1 Tax=Tsukamurella TaxID=2060 RepID=UPI001C7DD144|nr:hypothetical protein [Tsukamurella sp. TY48]GIZ98257.1 hypothetical protein TTY48_28690 [Tsukamurella sp. TY48]
MKKSVLPVLVVSTAALLGACGTTVSGQPTTAPSASSAAATVKVPAGLDTGTYPTTAKPQPPASTDTAWVVEGNRMGDEALIQANEVDPRLIIGGAGLRSFPVLRGTQLSERVPDATYKAFSSNNMRVGMTTTRGDKLEAPSVAVRIGLYRFDTPQDATKAVEAIRRATTAQRQVPITGTPNVLASEFKPGTVDSYLAEGAFVINVSGTGPTTDEGATFVNKAFQLELPKVKGFKPTPSSQVPSLPSDEDGILSRTLPLSGTEPNPELRIGYYDLNGLLHRIPDISKAATYKDAGVDLVGQASNVVYRTRSEKAATDFVKALAARDQPIAGIPALPSVTCTNQPTTKVFWCFVPVGRYVSTVSDANEAVAKQKASAQFSVLATTK